MIRAMSDRYKGLAVTLSSDLRDDDAEGLIQAIYLFKGIASVEPILANIDDQINRSRMRKEIMDKIWPIVVG